MSFAYWTDGIFDPTNPTPPDTNYNMITTGAKNTPAPWVPYTRAGCDVGSVATANTILENIGPDVPKVFGADSPEAQEVQQDPGQAFADFVGVGVHCARGAAACSSANNGRPDILPDEPGGYTAFNALYGNKYVAPVISPGGPMTDLDGNVIQDATGHVGFPGFDGMSATVSLSYVASMQEHGIPVTYAYISDVHDRHPSGPAYGPGEAGYVAALKSYDDAFGTFFSRLASDGINRSNTLFVFTVDEGDHFVGGPPSPPDCDGVTTPCTYSQIGEINANMTGLLATQQGVTTPFTVHADSAPTVYLTGQPGRTDPVVRNFERATGKLTAVNPITGQTDQVTNLLADPVEMKLLHMINADPARTPTFTMFADPNYFLFAGAPNCSSPCVTEVPAFAWNHGDVSPDINTMWLGMVGPGVRQLGEVGDVWTDQTDVRTTMLGLLGLKDDYAHDGRVVVEVLDPSALPDSLNRDRQTLLELGRVYKQLEGAVGELGLDTLRASTRALESESKHDKTYSRLEGAIAGITAQRNRVGAEMSQMLEAAAFYGRPINEGRARRLIRQGRAILEQGHFLAGG